MDAKKRRALTAAGFRAGNAEDFLGLTDEERHLVDLRLQVSRAIRRLREARRMTQQELADRLGSSQSRAWPRSKLAWACRLTSCFEDSSRLAVGLRIWGLRGMSVQRDQAPCPHDQVVRVPSRGKGAKFQRHVNRQPPTTNH